LNAERGRAAGAVYNLLWRLGRLRPGRTR
jgi:hypothetical protein